MPGFNTLPAVGGGGGQANMTFVASIHMSTYNRSWAQGGTAGYYAMYSTNQENGYAYFVGSGTTTGVPLNRLIHVQHAFTRIDVVAPQNDMLSLYKAKVKSTSLFNNALDGFASFPSIINSSGNFVLPNNALPLVNILLVGGGGGGGRHGGGGGGAGGVVKLTAYQAVGTTSITIGAAGRGHERSGNNNWGAPGGQTYFGNVYANGGGGGAQHSNSADNSPFGIANVANGGGGAGHGGATLGGTGTAQTVSTGLGTSGSPVAHGGFNGGPGHGSNHGQGGGGAGAGGVGLTGVDNAVVANGGPGHASNISGVNTHYSVGGSGGAHGPSGQHGPGLKAPSANWVNTGFGMGGFGGAADAVQSGSSTANDAKGWDGGNGLAIVRYYIP